MTDSVKFLSASYGAEYAKGPRFCRPFHKSGGQKFHGEGLPLRPQHRGRISPTTGTTRRTGQSNLHRSSFYYIGGNIGGPVFFPHFNNNRDKLFFWAGYEYMNQHPYATRSGGADRNERPYGRTAGGDFSNTGVDPKCLTAYPATYALPCNTDDGWQGCSRTISPWGGTATARFRT